MWQLGAGLAALTVVLGFLTFFRRLIPEGCVFCASAVLLVNWAVNTAGVHALGADFPWGFFLSADYVSGVFAIAGLRMLCGKFTIGGVAIGLSYALECIVHASFGYSDQGAWAQYRYWWTLYYIALGQALFILGWGIYELARNRAGTWRRLSPDKSVTSRAAAPRSEP